MIRFLKDVGGLDCIYYGILGSYVKAEEVVMALMDP